MAQDDQKPHDFINASVIIFSKAIGAHIVDKNDDRAPTIHIYIYGSFYFVPV